MEFKKILSLIACVFILTKCATLTGDTKNFQSQHTNNPIPIKFRIVIERLKNENSYFACSDSLRIEQQIETAKSCYFSPGIMPVIISQEFRDIDLEFLLDRDYVYIYNEESLCYPNEITIYCLFFRGDFGGLSNWISSKYSCLFICPNITDKYVFSHELGHFGGLYHTFELGGDNIKDTKDGVDPEYPNIMNYSICDTKEFTSGQMKVWFDNFRKYRNRFIVK